MTLKDQKSQLVVNDYSQGLYQEIEREKSSLFKFKFNYSTHSYHDDALVKFFNKRPELMLPEV